MRYILTFLVYITFVPVLLAQSFQRFNSLATEWQVYDEKSDVYVPYIHDLHFPVRKAHLLLKGQESASYTLMLKKDEGFLLVNNRLCYDFSRNSTLMLNVDSLFRLDTSKICLLSYYSQQTIYQFPEAFLGRFTQKPFVKKQVVSEEIRVRLLLKEKHRDFLLLASLLLLIVMAIVAKTSKSSIFSLDRESERLSRVGQTKKIGGAGMFSFVLLYALSVSFTIFFLAHHTDIIAVEKVSVPQNDFWDLQYSFLKLTLFIVFFLCIKYFLANMIGYLFQNNFIVNFHTQEYLNIARVLCVLWSLIAILAHAATPRLSPYWLEFLAYGAGVVWGLLALLITWRINRVASHQKLHLFSYLCATEYVPMFLLAKFFLKN